MTRTSEEMTREFHAAADHPIVTTPSQPSRERIQLRLNLVAEEVAELVGACLGYDKATADRAQEILKADFARWEKHAWETAGPDGYTSDIVGLAKEGPDVHVVTSGTLIEFGIPEDVCYAAVHRTNMAKVGGPKRPDGKSLKPEGWQPPDLAAILRRCGLSEMIVFEVFDRNTGRSFGTVRCLDDCEAITTVSDHHDDQEAVASADLYAVEKVTPVRTVSIIDDGSEELRQAIDRLRASGAHVTVHTE
jgi:predicted HAD superfamily Cof-like phosphohydrolase